METFGSYGHHEEHFETVTHLKGLIARIGSLQLGVIQKPRKQNFTFFDKKHFLCKNMDNTINFFDHLSTRLLLST